MNIDTLDIKFKVSLKSVKKAFVLMELDIPSDEELINKLSATVVDLSASNDTDTKQAELGFILCAISTAFNL